VILGNSNTPSALGFVMPLFDWAMPSRYHSIHKNDLARVMVAQSEQAFLALAQGKGPAAPAVKILEYQGDGAVLRGGRQGRAVSRLFRGDERERRQRQPSAGATYFRMLSITCAL
jgi:hypothetical protein